MIRSLSLFAIFMAVFFVFYSEPATANTKCSAGEAGCIVNDLCNIDPTGQSTVFGDEIVSETHANMLEAEANSAGKTFLDPEKFCSITRAIAETECWTCDFVGKFIQLVDVFAHDIFGVLAGTSATLLFYIYAIWLGIISMKLSLGLMGGTMAIKQVLVRTILFSLVWYLLVAVKPTFNESAIQSSPIVPGADSFVVPDIVEINTAQNQGVVSGAYWGIFWHIPLDFAFETSDKILNELLCLVDKNAIRIPGTVCGGREPSPFFTHRTCGEFTPIAVPSHVNRDPSYLAVRKFGEPTDGRPVIEDAVCMVERVDVVMTVLLRTSVEVLFGTFSLSNGMSIFVSWIPAVALVIVFGMAIVYFTFFVLDLFLRFGIISALAPLLLMIAFINDKTKNMAIQALQGMVTSVFAFIGAAISYGFLAIMISYYPAYVMQQNEQGAIGDGVSYASIMMPDQLATDTPGVQTIEHILYLLDNGKLTMGMGDAHFWYLFVIGLMAHGIVKKVNAITSAIFQFGDRNFNMADTAASITGRFAGGAMSMAGGLAAIGAGRAAMGVGGLGAQGWQSIGGAQGIADGLKSVGGYGMQAVGGAGAAAGALKNALTPSPAPASTLFSDTPLANGMAPKESPFGAMSDAVSGNIGGKDNLLENPGSMLATDMPLASDQGSLFEGGNSSSPDLSSGLQGNTEAIKSTASEVDQLRSQIENQANNIINNSQQLPGSESSKPGGKE